MTKIKNIITVALFMSILLGVLFANILAPDKDISKAERRYLSQKPDDFFENAFNKDFYSDYEKYILDQFILRDTLIKAKKAFSESLLLSGDTDGYYLFEDSICKMTYPLNKESLENAAEIFNDIKNTLFAGNDAYIAVIPDKNYFSYKKSGHLSIDYELFNDILEENTEGFTHIDLFDTVALSDYYRTDPHIKQESVLKLADRLLYTMKGKALENNFVVKTADKGFLGAYNFGIGKSVLPDTINYLENDFVNSASVRYLDTKKTGGVYVFENLENIDKYDFFLGGPNAVIEITNPNAKEENTLFIFRDSFASAVTPALIGEYSKIVLIDIRYISLDSLIERYIDSGEISISDDTDVLFLYNVDTLNNSDQFKK